MAGGGRLRIAGTGIDAEWPLEQSKWRTIRKRGANRGYKFRRGTPVRSIVIKRGKLLKIVARGEALPFDLAVDPTPVHVELTTGIHRYCWRFDDNVVFRPLRRFEVTNAAAPATCD